MKQIIAIIALVALVLAGGYYVLKYYKPVPSEVPVSITTFTCEQAKTIGAVFYQAKIDLTLSDGRKFELPQVTAASGARYANADQSFVFWNKGNTAFITEGREQAQSYSNCVTPGEAAPSTPELQSFSYAPLGFSIKYPAGYSLDESYAYDQNGPEAIPGIKVSIPALLASTTNLSKDSGVSVEYIPNAPSCTADLFLSGSTAVATTTDGGTTYSTASSNDAGAGNLYEEKVYALAGQNPCIAVRYFIHYTQIANYPAGVKKEFDRAALIADFDAIRHSLTLKNQSQ